MTSLPEDEELVEAVSHALIDTAIRVNGHNLAGEQARAVIPIIVEKIAREQFAWSTDLDGSDAQVTWRHWLIAFFRDKYGIEVKP